MGKDYKIGIVAGLLLLIVGVTYFLVSGSDDTKNQTDTTNQEPSNEIVLADSREVEEDMPAANRAEPASSNSTDWGNTFGGSDETTSSESSSPSSADSTTSNDTSSGGELTLRLVDSPESANNTGTSAPETTSSSDEKAPTRFVLPAVEAPSREESSESVDYGRDFSSGTESTKTAKKVEPAIEPPDDNEGFGDMTAIRMPESTVDLKDDGTYKVQPGDNGFWFVAIKVYGKGNGKHWKLIADANPKVRSEALRVGMVLNIPPLSPEKRRKKAASRAAYGTVQISPSGQKVYIVAKSDTAGLWGIAKKPKVYGKGHHWRLIQKANPSVDPTRMKPGTKLVIPPLPESSRTSVRDYSTPLPRPEPKRSTAVDDGKRRYAVKANDSLWSISMKFYGDGKYASLILKANPDIDGEFIQPGDKLVIPPKPAGATTTPRTRRTPRRTRPVEDRPIDEAVDYVEPDFGP